VLHKDAFQQPAWRWTRARRAEFFNRSLVFRLTVSVVTCRKPYVLKWHLRVLALCSFVLLYGLSFYCEQPSVSAAQDPP
jgi:hypothetical protein